MRIVTENHTPASVAARWERQYCGRTAGWDTFGSLTSGQHPKYVYDRLLALPPYASHGDIDAVIGNGDWTTRRCSCSHRTVEYVELSGIGDYLTICLPCARAIGRITAPVAAPSDPFPVLGHLYAERSQAGRSGKPALRCYMDADAAERAALTCLQWHGGFGHGEALGFCAECRKKFGVSESAPPSEVCGVKSMPTGAYTCFEHRDHAGPHRSAGGTFVWDRNGIVPSDEPVQSIDDKVSEILKLCSSQNRLYADIVRKTAVEVLAFSCGVTDESRILDLAEHVGIVPHEMLLKAVASYLSTSLALPNRGEIIARVRELAGVVHG